MSLEVNQIYEAKIEDLLERGEALVNFRGNFIRVKNKTSLKPGDKVLLKAKEITPNLIFEIVNGQQVTDPRRSRLNISG